jgi:MFS transporter, CP family, cyanate transporter
MGAQLGVTLTLRPMARGCQNPIRRSTVARYRWAVTPTDRDAVTPRSSIVPIAALFLAALALRPQLLAIGPLLPEIREDLDLTHAVAGLLGTIPVLCMGLFAPAGPRLVHAIGPRWALGLCLAGVAGFGIARAVAPDPLTILAATTAIGISIGSAGAIPSVFVKLRMPALPVLGTGSYAAGIVAGSTIAAALAVPLAGPTDDWRYALAAISLGCLGSLAAWLILTRGGPEHAPAETEHPRLPWRSPTAWLIVLVFALQSTIYYGLVAWFANAYVERGWGDASAGSLLALMNGIGLVTTIGVPLVADRAGSRRTQLLAASIVAVGGLLGILVAPDAAVLWSVLLGLSLGAVFPLVLTLPVDVADRPADVGAVAALMLLGGYVISSTGPVLLGTIRDVTGSFQASFWALLLLAV